MHPCLPISNSVDGLLTGAPFMPKVFTTAAFLLFDGAILCGFTSVSDTTILWPSRRTSGTGRKSIGCVRFVVRERGGVGAGARAIELERRCKVDVMRMDDGAGVAFCVIINREKRLDVDVDLLALAQKDSKRMSTRVPLSNQTT
jgi:hypothetical protein